MIVVDTNIVAYLLLPGEYTDSAESLYERDDEWAAPILWRSEFRNLLSSYMRSGRLDLVDAKRLQHEAESLLAGNEYEADSALVLDLAATSGCTAYDCEFVALSQRLDVPLVTLDRALLKAFPRLTRKFGTG
ncbi:MAG: type II toxin-antitoxin system VapC family toxin [Pseudomonadota bacterium]|nr:type II toxin-antitoxin system VapC family toxin [Pseudomonadota bacterium]